jgi:hypothetical protein
MKDYHYWNRELQGRCKKSRCLHHGYAYAVRNRKAIDITYRVGGRPIIRFHPNGIISLPCTDPVQYPSLINRIYRYTPLQGYIKAGKALIYLVDRSKARLLTKKIWLRNGVMKGGEDPAAFFAQIKKQRRERYRGQDRARYWIKKARGLSVDRTDCKAPHSPNPSYTGVAYCSSIGLWYNSIRRGQVFQCGCKVVHRPPSSKGLTVQSIMEERNTTVRSAMLVCYGVQKFFLDARAKIIDELGDEYQLLDLPMPELEDSWRSFDRVRALQMECPSTGEIYINPVPPNVVSVPQALNWIYNTDTYIETVGVQT